jgi:hypothetical protein
MAEESSSEEKPKTEDWRRFAPALGCGVGGCLIPFLLLIFCLAVLHDAGGPLFWPFIALPLGLLGLVIGLVIRSAVKAKDDKNE